MLPLLLPRRALATIIGGVSRLFAVARQAIELAKAPPDHCVPCFKVSVYAGRALFPEGYLRIEG